MNYPRLYKQIKRFYAYVPSKITPGLAFPPLHIFLELTYRCNLRCQFCQFLHILKDYSFEQLKKGELSLPEIKDVIDQIPSYCLITLTGGEPLLKEDFIEIVKYATKRHKVHIISNGTLIDKQMAKKLLRMGTNSLIKNGLFWISISLHGNEEVHDKITSVNGSFKRVMNSLHNLQEYKIFSYPKINLQTMITKKTIPSLSEVVQIAQRFGIKICNFMVQNTGEHFYRIEKDIKRGYKSVFKMPKPPSIEEDSLKRGLKKAQEMARSLDVQIRYQLYPDNYREIIKYYTGKINLKDYVCYAPWSTFGVSAYGDVGLCFSNMVGNVREKRLKDIWNGKKMQAFRKKLFKNRIFPGCPGCCFMEYQGPKSSLFRGMVK